MCARIWNNPVHHEPVPDKQHHEGTNRRRDKARTLVVAVPADGLADERGEKRSSDPEHSSQNKSSGLFGPGDGMRAMRDVSDRTFSRS